MPTGYTAKVEDGTVTELRDYMLICACAFGALIMMRDEPMDAPIPEKFEADTRYYDEKIAVVTKELSRIAALSADEALTESLAANNEIRRLHREAQNADYLRLDRHRAMAEKVSAWTPPTPEHVEYKTFMLQQLEVSSQWLGSKRDLLPLSIGEAWRHERLADLAHELAYSTKSRAEEIERAAGRQKWLDDLRASLPPYTGIDAARRAHEAGWDAA